LALAWLTLNHTNQGMSKLSTPVINTENKIPDAFKSLSSKIHAASSSLNGETRNPYSMITRVTTRPNPFSKSITIDIACDHSKHVIVRMTQVNGKIIRMFGWYLMKGTNITAINELSALEQGDYFIDIIDQEGNILFSTPVQK
jgi:hypothetical protein